MTADHVRKWPHVTQAALESVTDEHGRIHYYYEGNPVCGRLKKKKNRKIPNECCLGIPMQSGPCRIHGGKAGCPPKHGRYTRALKTWRPSFQRALNDSELLDSRRELAMMDTLIERLLERAEDQDAPGWRAKLVDAFDQLQNAIRQKRQGQVGEMLKRVADLIGEGAAIDQVNGELMKALDRRAARATKVDELNLRKEEKVTPTEIAAIFGQWLEVLEAGVDQPTYLRLVEKLRQVTAAQDVPVEDPAEPEESPDGESESPDEG